MCSLFNRREVFILVLVKNRLQFLFQCGRFVLAEARAEKTVTYQIVWGKRVRVHKLDARKPGPPQVQTNLGTLGSAAKQQHLFSFNPFFQ